MEAIQWKRKKIEPSTMKELTKRNDIKATIQLTIHLGLVIAFGFLAYQAFYSKPIWVSLPILYVYFILYSWLGRDGAFHELLHRTVFSKKKVNDFFYELTCFIGWMNSDYVRKGHLRHHHMTLHEKYDQDVSLDFPFTKWDILWSLTFQFKQFYSEIKVLIKLARGKFEGDFINSLYQSGKKDDRNKVVIKSRIVLLIHTFLIVVFILTEQYLLILMISFGSFFATWHHLVLSITQHVGMEKNVDDFRLNSRSIILGPIMGFLYWQMHYHVEHHLYPGVPFYNLSKLREELGTYLPERKKLISVWKEIGHYIKEMHFQES